MGIHKVLKAKLTSWGYSVLLRQSSHHGDTQGSQGKAYIMGILRLIKAKLTSWEYSGFLRQSSHHGDTQGS